MTQASLDISLTDDEIYNECYSAIQRFLHRRIGHISVEDQDDLTQ